MTLLVGLDVGTSALKGVVVRASDGAVIASAAHGYPLHAPRPGWAEQDGADFERSAFDVLAELAVALGALGHPKGAVRAIGLTGQMHTSMLIGANGALVRRAILWCDGRTTAQCRQIEAKLGLEGLRRTVKNLALEGFTLPKLLWLRAHEPDVFARVRKVVMPKDWVGHRLTGELETDVSDASGTLAFDPEARAWSREMLDAMEIDASLFPEARESPVPLGALGQDAAQRAGMPAGTLVVRGGADNAAAAVGLGVVREGRAMASIGTSGVVLAHTDALHSDAALRLHAFAASVPGASYSMGVMLSAGAALRWYRDTMGANRSYDELTALAARAKPGAGGVVFLPYLMGERTPHNDAGARAAFVGMSASTTEADLARAVLEGVAFGLADSLALMHARPTELRATGGGAKSAVWRQIIADVLDTPVVTTSSTQGGGLDPDQAPAFGAAILAGVGAGVWDSVQRAADALVKTTDATAPDPERAAIYRRVHEVYRGLYDDLRPRLSALALATRADSISS